MQAYKAKSKTTTESIFEREVKESGRVQEGFVCAEPTIGGAGAAGEVL